MSLHITSYHLMSPHVTSYRLYHLISTISPHIDHIIVAAIVPHGRCPLHATGGFHQGPISSPYLKVCSVVDMDNPIYPTFPRGKGSGIQESEESYTEWAGSEDVDKRVDNDGEVEEDVGVNEERWVEGAGLR